MTKLIKYEDIECGDIIKTKFGDYVLVELKEKRAIIGHKLGDCIKGMQKEGYEVINRDFRYKQDIIDKMSKNTENKGDENKCQK